MSRFAIKIKSIFSFNSDSYHVHKATEEELLARESQPQALQSSPSISVTTVLRPAPAPPNSGGSGGENSRVTSVNSQKSICVKATADKKQSRKVS